ncbi:MAG: hypothetical protein JST86_05645 [Bacteroidetes bacterium]|nr:hypothetical protein [Bacteroidota bacterium]
MAKQASTKKIPVPPGKKNGEEELPVNPEDVVLPSDDSDIVDDDDPFETPPYETPEPGEGP